MPGVAGARAWATPKFRPVLLFSTLKAIDGVGVDVQGDAQAIVQTATAPIRDLSVTICRTSCAASVIGCANCSYRLICRLRYLDPASSNHK